MLSGTIRHFNFVDDKGNPAGGHAFGRGFAIAWQKGPLKATFPGGTEPVEFEPNGAFVEDIIQVAIDRILFYQGSKFACKENADALVALQMAAQALDERTKNRIAAGVEGTNKV